MEKRSPAETVGMLGREAKLLRDVVGERPDPLGVPAAPSIVSTEGRAKPDDVVRLECIASDSPEWLGGTGRRSSPHRPKVAVGPSGARRYRARAIPVAAAAATGTATAIPRTRPLRRCSGTQRLAPTASGLVRCSPCRRRAPSLVAIAMNSPCSDSALDACLFVTLHDDLEHSPRSPGGTGYGTSTTRPNAWRLSR